MVYSHCLRISNLKEETKVYRATLLEIFILPSIVKKFYNATMIPLNQ